MDDVHHRFHASFCSYVTKYWNASDFLLYELKFLCRYLSRVGTKWISWVPENISYIVIKHCFNPVLTRTVFTAPSAVSSCRQPDFRLISNQRRAISPIDQRWLDISWKSGWRLSADGSVNTAQKKYERHKGRANHWNDKAIYRGKWRK